MTLLRAGLILAILVLVGGLAWHAYTVHRADADERQRVRLEALRASVTEVDNLAMSAGNGLLPSYDPLVDALKILRTRARALARDAKGAPQEADVLRFLDAVEERTRNVDEIKSLRSGLNNGERFLRDRLVAPQSAVGAESPAILRLKELLLAQRLVPDDQRNLDALHDLRRTLVADPHGGKLVTQLDLVLESRRRLTDHVNRLLQLEDGLASRAASLANKQQSVLEAHRREANDGRGALLSLALLVVVAVLWLPHARRA